MERNGQRQSRMRRWSQPVLGVNGRAQSRMWCCCVEAIRSTLVSFWRQAIETCRTAKAPLDGENRGCGRPCSSTACSVLLECSMPVSVSCPHNCNMPCRKASLGW
eukprot:366286-Chlamydomonas_euryale.AAC.3